MTSSAINNDEVRTRERKRIPEEREKKREEKGERERESWRAFLVTFRLPELPSPPLPPISSSPSPVLLFRNPVFGQTCRISPPPSPVPPALTLSRLASSGNSRYSLPACLAKRNSRGGSLYAEFPGVIRRKSRPFPRNVHFSGFRGLTSSPLMNLSRLNPSRGPESSRNHRRIENRVLLTERKNKKWKISRGSPRFSIASRLVVNFNARDIRGKRKRNFFFPLRSFYSNFSRRKISKIDDDRGAV